MSYPMTFVPRAFFNAIKLSAEFLKEMSSGSPGSSIE